MTDCESMIKVQIKNKGVKGGNVEQIRDDQYDHHWDS